MSDDLVEKLERISTLMDRVEPASELGVELAEALDTAGDCVEFCQGLWNIFGDLSLHTQPEGSEPDLGRMEKMFDLLNGELTAAVMLLINIHTEPEQLLRYTASVLDDAKREGLADEVTPVLIESHRRLAQRIENTKTVYEAKKLMQDQIPLDKRD